MVNWLSGWWLSPTPPKNDGVSNSWDDDIPFPIWWKNHAVMFQTTNQITIIFPLLLVYTLLTTINITIFQPDDNIFTTRTHLLKGIAPIDLTDLASSSTPKAAAGTSWTSAWLRSPDSLESSWQDETLHQNLTKNRKTMLTHAKEHETIQEKDKTFDVTIKETIH